jgi:opacity protein-like surface antigen
MKKILLATALAAVSISATEANWGGFYARGGLAGFGFGNAAKVGDKAVAPSAAVIDGDLLVLAFNAELAAGWGMTVANAVYLGVDASLGNFGLLNVSYGAENAKSTTAINWMPSLHARVGVPFKVAMPYIAGGMGYHKVISVTDVDSAKLPDGKFTFSGKVGCDFKVTESLFVGPYVQYSRELAKEEGEGAAKKSQAFGLFTVGFTAGYQF